ncbi:Sec20-domain-containing protein [Trichodelitschia bisporula]|uniref:Sec20-domain-containing protein n=1 Tax=Trichodelitschia bisporula TaxID=703511 RepID=A0A6G1I4K7_9PEZI|nr:Sec20-domain-containing protein [Trichodelitschia bisporula]
MTSLPSLTARLNALSENHKTTLLLINRLAKLSFQPGSLPPDSTAGDVRIELSADIHESLKRHEEELELLRQEVEDLRDDSHGQRRRESERDREATRVRIQVARLGEDLRHARGQFRKAQLQAKRSAEAAKQKEREIFLASLQRIPETPTASSPPLPAANRRQERKKLTDDEIVVNAASDVTAALRRTQQLMQTELTRSRFAQETFDQSTAALAQLSEQYSNLDSLLSASKSLLSTLVTSQKSDTWYLETAFYILVTTISWLVFRRLLYGPLWWFLWLPIKLLYRFTATILTGVGIVGTSRAVSNTSSTLSISAVPSFSSATQEPEVSPDSSVYLSSHTNPEGSISEEIGSMAEQSRYEAKGQGEPVRRGDGQILEESDAPRNPKKRVLNLATEEQAQLDNKDELARRGDDQILEKTEQPRNPHKRMLDTEAVQQDGNRDEL